MIEPSTTIVLGKEQVTVTTVKENGVKKVVSTNIENLQQIFMREQAVETPLLPSQWGVIKYYRKNNYEGYVMTTPPGEREVHFPANTGRGIPTEMLLPMPPMVWIFEIRQNTDGSKTLSHSMVYVIQHEVLSLKDKVLHAPYPNIGVNHGICWGSGHTPLVPSSKSVQNIPARFFSQPFNFDLAANRVQEFETMIGSQPSRTDSAVYHMVKTANDYQEAQTAGRPYTYPFQELKPVGTKDLEQVIRLTLPGIFV